MLSLLRQLGLRLSYASTILLPFHAPAAPEITRQPESVVVTAGQNATLTALATGSSTVTYQWRRRGFFITGASSSTLVLPRVTRADADMYSVVVTDSTGSTTSNAVWLTVAPTAYPTDIATDLTYEALFYSDEVLVHSVRPCRTADSSPPAPSPRSEQIRGSCSPASMPKVR